MMFIAGLMYFGCKESPNSPVTNNYYYYTDSLSDPAVKPKVIFTNPANGAVGPFSNDAIYNANIQAGPQIVIQFNKLMNVFNLSSTNVRLTANNVAYPISLADYSYSPGLSNLLVFGVGYKYLAGKIYTVTVDTTLLDVHGYKLSAPYTFSFTPEPQFRVYSGTPTSAAYPDGINPGEFSPIIVDLNSKIDTTIFNKFQISPAIAGEWVLNPYTYFAADSTTAYFVSTDTLAFDTQYTVSVRAGANDVNGLLTKAPYQFSFTTQPFSAIVESWSSTTGPGGFTVFENIDYSFDGFVDTASIRPSISISPSLSFNLSFYSYNGGYRDVYLMPNIQQMQRNTTYTITMSTAARSRKGTHLKNAYSYSFTTGT